VYGIVKQSGGYIWFYSEPGKGTTFKVYLPRTEEAIGPSIPKPKAQPVRGSETILVVEDQPLLRELAQVMLEQDGYAVLSAENPGKALEMAQAHGATIHLLLTDVVLPGMNGRALAENIKNTRPEVKVLFVSGYAENIIAHHGGFESGAGFLQKPFTHDTLSSKVREVLDQPR